MEQNSKAILEQIFGGTTAKILDHLEMTRPFEFSRDELCKIHDMKDSDIFNILQHLISYGLVEMIGDGKNQKYKLADNEKTRYLNKLLYLIMCDFLDSFKSDD